MQRFFDFLKRIRKLFTRTKEQKLNNDISAQQKIARENAKKEFKILLLGTGESGKSTVFKQMQFLYGTNEKNSVTKLTKEVAAVNCYKALIGETQIIIRALLKPVEERGQNDLPKEFSKLKDATMKAAEELLKIVVQKDTNAKQKDDEEEKKKNEKTGFSKEGGLHKETVEWLKVIWGDETIQKVWSDCRSKLQVSEAWGYFIKTCCEKFPSWGGAGWLPSDEEYLLVRVRTTGVRECVFSVNDITEIKAGKKPSTPEVKPGERIEIPMIKLIDVGGQKSERKKWVNAFDGVPMVLYVVASSEYDQVSFDDLTMNRLKDSLITFESVVKEKAFKETSFILFLNKADLLHQKLCEKKIPLNVSGEFPNAPDTFDFEEAVNWLKNEYESRMKDPTTGELKNNLFVHVTTATDQENARKILDSLVTSVLEQELNLLMP